MLVLRRDLRHLSQLVTPLIFGIMYGILFLVGRNQPSVANAAAPDWLGGTFPSMLSFGNISLAVMVGWMLLARLASMGFSSEGKNFWMLKAAPVSARQMLTAKFMVAYLPSLALSISFLVVFSLLQKVPLATAAYSALALTMSLAGMAGILLAFGVGGANFNWDDPRRNNAGKVGCLGSVISMMYLPIVLGLFIGPLALVTYAAFPVGYAYLLGGFLGSVAGIAGMLLPLHLAIPIVDRLDES